MSEQNNLYIYALVSLLFIILTNQNFTLNENMLYGAIDGNDYLFLSKLKAEFIDSNVNNHKVWRFFFPYGIGVIARITEIEIHTIYKIFNFTFAILGIFFFIKILEKKQIKINTKILFISLLIFNMYTYRYFLTLPVLINDFIFMNAGIIISYALIYKKRFLIYIGLILSVLTRQNAILILLSFYLIKFFFGKKSYLTSRDLFYLSLIFVIIFLINTTFADYISDTNRGYSFADRFGILKFDYNILSFLKFIFTPSLVIFPIIFILFFFKPKYNENIFKNEETVYLLIVIMLLSGIAFSAGINITGKNILRFIGALYPLILIFLCLIIKNIEIKKNYLMTIIILLITFSFHPTYSKIQILIFLKNYLNNLFI